MKIAVLKESAEGETRVALVPESAGRLIKAGQEILVESGAGSAASFADEVYTAAGARIVADKAALLKEADVVLKVGKPTPDEIAGMREGAVLITFIYPVQNPDLVMQLVTRKITSFSMDAIPRISRAQSMDALSSMSTVAGYKAVLLAAARQGKFFPMLTTAAGTIAPARALILGAGVAGLQAIATARRLGAIVYAFDVRPAVKEQVESLGAKFVEMDVPHGAEDKGGYATEQSEDFIRREMEAIHKVAKDSDVIITTALIPGKPAPKLITEAMLKDMKPGSVVIDLASEMGGNCELTQPGKEIIAHDIIINGVLNVPASMPIHASQMYSRNVLTLLNHLTRDKALNLDWNDEITRGTCITHDGNILHGPTKAVLEAAVN
ncbi:MAG: Re/Si-specific NAD(P)(+) transhydrogenase subunit alpha [Armatimonadetes bacterium]|nr:Re/Si-specific NAD(P)(+) transhydrogenase subunit alpha [Armatimonadota bacterium]